MNIFILDCGQCGSHAFNTTSDEYHKIEHSEVINLNIPKIKSGDLIVVEDAHMRSQEKNSLAQPFTFDQLKEIEKNAYEKNIEIRLFPQKSTPTARKLASLEHSELLEKTDENDVKAIAYFLKNSPESFSTLKKFSPITLDEYVEKSQYIFDARNELNQDINLARNQVYGLKDNGYSDAVSLWIKKYSLTLASRLNDRDICNFAGLELNKNSSGLKDNVKKYKSDKLKFLYNVVNTILTPQGKLRVRPDNNLPPYWKYAKKVYFAMTPYHMRGGVTASNYKYHKRKASSPCKHSMSLESKNAIKTIDDYKEIKKARTDSDKKLRKIWREVRKMIVEEKLI
jgi:hypothetical protein